MSLNIDLGLILALITSLSNNLFVIYVAIQYSRVNINEVITLYCLLIELNFIIRCFCYFIYRYLRLANQLTDRFDSLPNSPMLQGLHHMTNTLYYNEIAYVLGHIKASPRHSSSISYHHLSVKKCASNKTNRITNFLTYSSDLLPFKH